MEYTHSTLARLGPRRNSIASSKILNPFWAGQDSFASEYGEGQNHPHMLTMNDDLVERTLTITGFSHVYLMW